MECDNSMYMSGSSVGPAGSRWNPTKEQIDLLENLYSQGVRTPSTDQIQNITSKLRAFGHIEGKNVFYWFQNHKARQRQKQKQESMEVLNRFMFHRQPPLPPPFATYTNVAYHPSFYIPPPPPPPQTDFGCRPSYQKLLIPGGSYKKRALLPETCINTSSYAKPSYYPDQESLFYQQQRNQRMEYKSNEKGFDSCKEDNINNQETLHLFPLHPTGNLQVKSASFSDPCTSTSISASSCNNYANGNGNFGHDQPFIDFLCIDGQCKSS